MASSVITRRTKLEEARALADAYKFLLGGQLPEAVRDLYERAFIAADNAANALDAASSTTSPNRGWALRSKARTYLNQAHKLAAEAAEKSA